MNATRRGFLFGAASLLAAPAIVRVSSLMPVKMLPFEFAEMTAYEVGTLHTQFMQEFIENYERSHHLLRGVTKFYDMGPNPKFEVVRT